jgi:hypothetical protein
MICFANIVTVYVARASGIRKWLRILAYVNLMRAIWNWRGEMLAVLLQMADIES